MRSIFLISKAKTRRILPIYKHLLSVPAEETALHLAQKNLTFTKLYAVPMTKKRER